MSTAELQAWLWGAGRGVFPAGALARLGDELFAYWVGRGRQEGV